MFDTSVMPKGIRYLPRNSAGVPVPWVVAWFDGKPDFRIIGPNKITIAINVRLCWLCGKKMNRREGTFTIGPMCAVNRTTAEPPSHWECAEYAAQVCPFLVNPQKQRRETNRPPDAQQPAGEMINAIQVLHSYGKTQHGDCLKTIKGKRSLMLAALNACNGLRMVAKLREKKY
jgi:hypothetical protein